MSHSVVRGAIFIPPPTPRGGLSYYILLTRQFGIYLEYNRRYLEYDSSDISNTTVVISTTVVLPPNTTVVLNTIVVISLTRQ